MVEATGRIECSDGGEPHHGVQDILEAFLTKLRLALARHGSLLDQPGPVYRAHFLQIEEEDAAVDVPALRVPGRLLRDRAEDCAARLDRAEVLPQARDIGRDDRLGRQHDEPPHLGQELCREQRDRGALRGACGNGARRLRVHVASLHRRQRGAGARRRRARRRQRTARRLVSHDVEPQRHGSVV